MALEKAGIKVAYYDSDPDVVFVERFSSKGFSAHLGISCEVIDNRIEVEKIQEVISSVRRCEIREKDDGTRYVWVNRYTPEKEVEIVERYWL